MAESPIESMRDVASLFKEDYKEIVREQKLDLVNRPLLGEKRSAKEQEQRYDGFRSDPLLIASETTFLGKRFKLTKEHPVPRRLVDYLLRGARRRKERN